jgi:hypothetical protein
MSAIMKRVAPPIVSDLPVRRPSASRVYAWEKTAAPP